MGTRAPIKSLRVALGGVYLPQTAVGRLCQLVFTLPPLSMDGLLLFAMTRGDNSAGRFLN